MIASKNRQKRVKPTRIVRLTSMIPGAQDRPLILTLGGLRALGRTGSVSRFDQRRSALLLARLALARGKPVGRESLAALLWPGDSPDQTLPRLRQALVGLRQGLAHADPDLAEAVVSDRSEMRLDLGAVELDLVHFERLLALARSSAPSSAPLRAAFDLYQGALLPEYQNDWIAAERRHLELARRDAVLAVVQRKGGEFAPLYAILGVLIADDPLDEEVARATMALCQEHGRATEGVRAYETLRQNLSSQLGLAPAAETDRMVAGLRDAVSGRVEIKPSPSDEDRASLAAWAEIPGGFDVRAAVAVDLLPGTVPRLSRLRDVGLLIEDRAGPVVRYRVADNAPTGTLDEASIARVRGGLIEHTIRVLTDAHDPGLRRLRGVVGEQLSRDADLVLAAFDWADSMDRATEAARIALLSQRLFVYLDRGDAADALVTRALARNDLSAPDRRSLCLARAHLRQRRGDIAGALRDVGRVATPADPETDGRRAYTLALIATTAGRMRAASRFLGIAVNRFLRAERPHEALDALTVRGVNAQIRGRYADARADYRQAFAQADALGDDLGVGVALHHEATLALELGELDEAHRVFRQAARVFEASGDALAVAWVRKALAVYHATVGDGPSAHEEIRRTRETAISLGDVGGAASCHEIAMVCDWLLGHGERALGHGAALARELASRSPERSCGEAILIAACITAEEGLLALGARLLGSAERMAARQVSSYPTLKARTERILARLRSDEWAVERSRGALVPRRLVEDEIEAARLAVQRRGGSDDGSSEPPR